MFSRRNFIKLVAACSAAAGASCKIKPDYSIPEGGFAFGVFGDGPYYSDELERFERLIEDVNSSDIQWLMHVGDLLRYPCTDAMFRNRLDYINSIKHPVIYTPGDNEWADSHDSLAGGFQPLERLRVLRKMFYPDPYQCLGGKYLALDPQSQDAAFAEFVENARWEKEGFLFTTIHISGSSNATEPFETRGAANDAEVERRTEAGLEWLKSAFAMAKSKNLKGVFLTIHANPGLEREPEPIPAYEEFVETLEQQVKNFNGPVWFIHGDTHYQRVDNPLVDRSTGKPYINFTRLETFGSPDIGWVRVIVDSVHGRVTQFEPRLIL